MKTILLSAAALLSVHISLAQNKTFDLTGIGEGNFGTPNGDVVFMSTHSTPTVQTGGQYQAANGTGINVLQDFEIVGNKAILLQKANPYSIKVVDYPSFTLATTHTNVGAPQSAVKVSNTTAYVSSSNPNAIRKIDVINGTATLVSDPSSRIGTYSDYMVFANGFVYAALGSNIVKIDTASNTAVNSFTAGVGSIATLIVEPGGQNIWALGKVSGTSAAAKIEVTNNDLVNAPVVFTGVTNGKHLRYFNSQLFFWAGQTLHRYNITTAAIPTTTVYASALTGAFGYGKSFAVDPQSGDFAIGSANNYSNPLTYEIIDGTTFQAIASGTLTGCIIPNELMVKTYVASPSITPSVASLPTIQGQCSATVSAPTATGPSGTLTGVTTSPVSYSSQGTYTLSWTYTDGTLTATQNQTVVVNDNTAPVPTQASLTTVNAACSVALTAPTANDNCSGVITATTTAPMSYSAQGTYTVNWVYTDAKGNSSSQTQTVVVNDNVAPVPDVATLPTANGTCSITLTAPTANDNCSGVITATTTAPLTYTAVGTYTLNWTYTDAAGNTATQTQTVVVVCNTTGIAEAATTPVRVYPNPASEVFHISLQQTSTDARFMLIDQLGHVVKMLTIDQQLQEVTVGDLPAGLYHYQLRASDGGLLQTGKLLIAR